MNKRVFKYSPPPPATDSSESSDSDNEDQDDRKVLTELIMLAVDYMAGIMGGRYTGCIRRAIINMAGIDSTSDIPRSLVRTKCMMLYQQHKDSLPVDPLRRAHAFGSLVAPKIGILSVEIKPELLAISSELGFYPHAEEICEVEGVLFAGKKPTAGKKSTPMNFTSTRDELTEALEKMSDVAIMEIVNRLGIHRKSVAKPVAQIIAEKNMLCGDPDSLPTLNADIHDLLQMTDVPENVRIQPVAKASSRAVSPRSTVRKNAGEYLSRVTTAKAGGDKTTRA